MQRGFPRSLDQWVLSEQARLWADIGQYRDFLGNALCTRPDLDLE